MSARQRKCKSGLRKEESGCSSEAREDQKMSVSTYRRIESSRENGEDVEKGRWREREDLAKGKEKHQRERRGVEPFLRGDVASEKEDVVVTAGKSTMCGD